MIEDGLAAFAAGFHYCEMTSFGPIAQPVNVAGNLGFILIFAYSWHLIGLRTLTISTLFIFLGSSLWHTTLHPVGLLLDILPILVWVIVYLWAVSRYFTHRAYSALIVFTFLFSTLIVTRYTADIFPMRSGIFIISAMLMFFTGCILYYFRRSYAYLLVGASLLMGSAIIARLLDLLLCEYIPFGTHWLWHLLSSFTIFPLVRLLYLIHKHNKKFV